jgi:hypothetical protein
MGTPAQFISATESFGKVRAKKEISANGGNGPELFRKKGGKIPARRTERLKGYEKFRF